MAAIVQGGGAPAVVLFHGFTGTPWEVQPVAEALSASGYAVSAPLLPGHGTSIDALARCTWDDWITAARRDVDAALAGYGRVIVGGFSLGALLALVIASERQHEGVEGVMSFGAAMHFGDTAMRALRVAWAMGPWMPDVRVPKMSGSDVRDPEMKRKNPAYDAQPLRAARHFLTGQQAARDALVELTVPLLAVHGRLDATVPFSASLELVARAERAECTLAVMPRSAHLVGVDVEREEVAKRAAQFVRGVDERTRSKRAPATSEAAIEHRENETR